MLFLYYSLKLESQQIEKAMNQVFEDRVAVDSKQSLNLIDERFPGDWNVQNGELYNVYGINIQFL